MYENRKKIVVMTIILTFFLAVFGMRLPEVLHGNGFEMEGSFSETNEILEKEFGHSSSPYIIVFTNEKNGTQDEFHQYIDNSLERIKKVKGITEVLSPLTNPNQMKSKIAYALVSFENKTEPSDNIHNLEKTFIPFTAFETNLTGGAVLEEEMNQSSQSDLKTAEMIGLPVALVVLLLAFGGVAAGLIPLISGAISVLSAMGVCYFLGLNMDLSVFVLNVTPMIGLALSIDFALLIIHRFRDELKNNSISEAVSITTKTAGRAIIFSGSCVALGMSGMLFIDIDIFRSVAISGIVVVIVSVILAITFLPALLGVLGKNINKWSFFKQVEEDEEKTFWHRFASFVMKKPISMALITFVILGIGIIPIKDINLEIPSATALPETSKARIAFEKFEENFISPNSTQVPIVITTKEDVTHPESLTYLEGFINDLSKDKLVDHVDSIYSYSQIPNSTIFAQALQIPEQKMMLDPLLKRFVKGQKTFIQVTLKATDSDKASKDWVRNFEKKYGGYKVGGSAKFHQEIFDEIWAKAPYGAAFILISTFIILLVAFRSIAIPIKAVFMNILSLSSAFGIIVWIFQGGHFGVTASPIALMIPIFAFSIVFGLSMDYEVFLISRIHEIYVESGDNDYATLKGLTSTSKIITSAAAIMIAVTGAFAFTDIMPVKQIGVGVALSIFIDATLIRIILVPSLMRLLGEWNWWLPGVRKVRKATE
ncbi:MAG: family transporter [Bacillales bacterium]|jgi:RND superfamily putative drug exporter|nr:family transporter [Bacillales bacterium]